MINCAHERMKLGLGTAQFGLDYGVSNKRGKTPSIEVKRILALAVERGIELLDTAALYGESEAAIGNALSPHYRFRIVTKTPVFKRRSLAVEDGKNLVASFYRSLDYLRQDRLYGLLVHDPDDLLVPDGAYLIEAMQQLVAKGLVQKIGVSVYTGEQIDRVLAIFRPDIVQLPVNLFDQRLIESGHLVKLKNLNIEIHARSLFLQGLLLMEPTDVPAYFSPIREHFALYSRFLESNGLTKLQAALLFVRQQVEIDFAIVGVTCASELSDIIAASDTICFRSLEMSDLHVRDEAMITPSLWKL